MNGPEHYQHAEMLLGEASDAEYGDPREGYCLAKAQVHATLALAAATAMNDAEGGMGTQDWDAWREAVSLSKPARLAPPECGPDDGEAQRIADTYADAAAELARDEAGEAGRG